MQAMYPLAGRYGPFLIYSFTLVIWLGIALALALVAWRARQRPVPNWLDALLFSGALALIGGRAAFVAAQWEYFGSHVPEIFWFWRGGQSYHAVLLTGMAALWFWSRRQGRSFGRYADLLAPSLVLLQAFGWGACWLDGCAYGRETTLSPLAAALPDQFGVFAVRYRTQAAGIVWSLAVLLIVLWQDGRNQRGANPQHGRLFWLVLALLSSGRLLITLGRGDLVPEVGTVRLDTWLDGSLAIISLIKWGHEAYDWTGTDKPQPRKRGGQPGNPPADHPGGGGTRCGTDHFP
jgi:phosphatidylglycerol---prolipoprotein diacylglyceryl transferase